MSDAWDWAAVEQDWPLPPLDRAAQGDYALYWHSAGLHRPQRRLLKRVLERLMPWESLVEIGSHVGPNLRVARSVAPTASLCGLDAREDYVTWGQRLSDASGLDAHYAQAQGDTFDVDRYRAEVVLLCHVDGVYPVRQAWAATGRALVVIGLPAVDVVKPLGLTHPTWEDREDDEHLAVVVCRETPEMPTATPTAPRWWAKMKTGI